MPRITGARAVVEVFKEEGISHVFHLPGSQILALGVKFDYQSTRHNFDIIPEKAKIVHVSINTGLKSSKPFVIDVMMNREELQKPGFL